MPSITCKCGNQIRYGNFPSPNEWIIMSEEKFDKYPSDTKIAELLMDSSSILRCPNCERIWIYWEKFGVNPMCYVLEPPNNDVLKE